MERKVHERKWKDMKGCEGKWIEMKGKAMTTNKTNPPQRLENFTWSSFTDSSSLLGFYGVLPLPKSIGVGFAFVLSFSSKKSKKGKLLLCVDLGKRPTSDHERTWKRNGKHETNGTECTCKEMKCGQPRRKKPWKTFFTAFTNLFFGPLWGIPVPKWLKVWSKYFLSWWFSKNEV